MPNHVQNCLVFSGKETIKKVISRLSKKEVTSLDDLSSREILDFNWILPPPSTKEELIQNYGKEYLNTEDSYIQPNKDKPWLDWYKWQVDNWGTKWNCYETYIHGNSIYFQTAWDIPKPIINKLAELLPDIPFNYMWAEEQNGYYCGKMDHNIESGGDGSGGGGEDQWVYFEEYSDEAYEMYNELWGFVFYKTVNHGKWVSEFSNNIFEVDGDMYDYDLNQADLEEAKEYHERYGSPFDEMIINAWKDTHADWLQEIGIKTIE
ncbi:hypothetical protein PIROE2DRAFT_59971 [Piromyces sp. E2]|nr:hypothetical protein PIROE2DRAFT_59971 [Piromyces sp. E2]|eukprot:OUM65463.1 hypothetical protein PIROE2DRAFT_59971 [Piromyces sp. E2]